MSLTNFVSLENSKDAADLYRSSKEVVAYHTPTHVDMEQWYDALYGKHWTDEEEAFFKRKKKTAIVLNQLKPAERTILGLFIQNKYDVKFSPREGDDSQGLSDVLSKLYAYTAYSQDWAYKDISMVRQAWCGGVAYMEVYVDAQPGKEPCLLSQVLNPFSIFFDPESRQVITREDAEFVDRHTWVSFAYLQERWPEFFISEEEMAGGASGYVPSKEYVDRSAQYYDAKNNRYKIIERYYKTRKKVFYGMDLEWNRVDFKDQSQIAKAKSEGYQIFSETQEVLNLAIACPAAPNKANEYLYNGPYHCQPRDVVTKKIIWPFVEMVAEEINGKPSGFVKHLYQANRLINSSVSNIFHANKHASSTGLIRKKKLFGANEKMAKDFDKNHTDADRVFEADNGADLGADLSPIPKSIVSNDTRQTYDIGDTEFQRLSSTPPSIQGNAESGPTSGVLNSQRIEQSFVQLQPFIANIKFFLRRRAELAYYYWREYYTYPKEIKIIGQKAAKAGQPKQPQSVVLNQEVPTKDWQGNLTGDVMRVNDINAATFDIGIEDSYESPTYRAKRQQQLSDMIAKAQGMDPELAAVLFGQFAKSTDMDQEAKDAIDQMTQKRQEAANQPPAPPPPKPPNISFAFKGEDLSNPAVLEIMRANNVLPGQVIDSLEKMSAAKPQGDTEEPGEVPDPVDQAKTAHEIELTKAKTEGQHLKNTQTMQQIADSEAAVAAMSPDNQATLTAFSPRVPA